MEQFIEETEKEQMKEQFEYLENHLRRLQQKLEDQGSRGREHHERGPVEGNPYAGAWFRLSMVCHLLL